MDLYGVSCIVLQYLLLLIDGYRDGSHRGDLHASSIGELSSKGFDDEQNEWKSHNNFVCLCISISGVRRS
jgi:hypothetical protein